MQSITSQAFNALNDKEVVWACIGPYIDDIRGRDFETKKAAYLQLTPGLQALLAFQILYGHTSHGVQEFYDHLAYLLPHTGVWSILRSGIEYFGDHALSHLLAEMEDLYRQMEKGTHIDAPELEIVINKLNRSLHEQIPISLKTLGDHIRQHPADFVVIKD